jgi:heme A synthase
MQDVHSFLAYPLSIALLFFGIWGMVRATQGKSFTPPFTWIPLSAQILLIGQALIGIYLWLVEGRLPLNAALHIALGTLAALLVGFLNGWLRRNTSAQALRGLSITLMIAGSLTLLATLTATGG